MEFTYLQEKYKTQSKIIQSYQQKVIFYDSIILKHIDKENYYKTLISLTEQQNKLEIEKIGLVHKKNTKKLKQVIGLQSILTSALVVILIIAI